MENNIIMCKKWFQLLCRTILNLWKRAVTERAAGTVLCHEHRIRWTVKSILKTAGYLLKLATLSPGNDLIGVAILWAWNSWIGGSLSCSLQYTSSGWWALISAIRGSQTPSCCAWCICSWLCGSRSNCGCLCGGRGNCGCLCSCYCGWLCCDWGSDVWYRHCCWWDLSRKLDCTRVITFIEIVHIAVSPILIECTNRGSVTEGKSWC